MLLINNSGRHILFWVLMMLVLSNVMAADITKSPNDRRLYKNLQLTNGLQVLLISDPKTDKAAAALDVGIGSSSDPARWPGLAHFLEHMLFLGTRKFPETGEYQAFITRNGGSDNAYTADANTNYFFDINPEVLRPALERFSQFFIAPLFTAKFVEREKNAINSEFHSRSQSTGRRRMSAVRQVMNPVHPWSKFSVGNLETLADKPDETARQALLRFYQRHYSANIMTLVVLGREDLPTLQAWVKQLFSAIPDNKTSRSVTSVPLFTSGTLPLRLQVQALRDKRSLGVTFPIPALLPYYRSKPMHIVGELLGHEGAGSLLSVLKQKGWARSLSAGGGAGKENESTFDVNIGLTRAGLEHQDDVLALLFQAIQLIKMQGIQSWVYAEQSKLTALQFRFKTQSDAQATVRSAAQNMQDIPIQDVLVWPWLMQGFDPALTKRLLAYLQPENTLITVMAPGYQSMLKTPWYATAYQRSKPDPAILARWKMAAVEASDLSLPRPNAFIPEKLQLVSADKSSSIPTRLPSLSGWQVWHQTDVEFKAPRSSFYFSIRSLAANDSPRHTLLTELFVRLVKDQLNQYAYNAGLAGLRYDLYRHIRGITVRLGGYSDKQSLLLRAIADALHQPILSNSRFAVLKNALLDELRNNIQRKPYVRAMSEVRTLLIKRLWTDDEKIHALQTIKPGDIRKFLPKLWNKTEVVVLSHGNVSARQTKERVQLLQRHLQLPASSTAVPAADVIDMPRGQHFERILATTHPDAATVLYFQGWNKSWKQRAQFALLGQIMSSPFYRQLRTEQQLGYVVFATGMPMLNYPGLALVIESPAVSAIELAKRMQGFLRGFEKNLENMSVQRFATHKQALISQFNEEEKNLRTRSARYWREIDDELENFNSRRQMTNQLQQLDLNSLKILYREAVLEAKKSASLLVLHAGKQSTAGQSTGAVDPLIGSEIKEITAFKSRQKIFSLPIRSGS